MTSLKGAAKRKRLLREKLKRLEPKIRSKYVLDEEHCVDCGHRFIDCGCASEPDEHSEAVWLDDPSIHVGDGSKD